MQVFDDVQKNIADIVSLTEEMVEDKHVQFVDENWANEAQAVVLEATAALSALAFAIETRRRNINVMRRAFNRGNS